MLTRPPQASYHVHIFHLSAEGSIYRCGRKRSSPRIVARPMRGRLVVRRRNSLSGFKINKSPCQLLAHKKEGGGDDDDESSSSGDDDDDGGDGSEDAVRKHRVRSRQRASTEGAWRVVRARTAHLKVRWTVPSNFLSTGVSSIARRRRARACVRLIARAQPGERLLVPFEFQLSTTPTLIAKLNATELRPDNRRAHFEWLALRARFGSDARNDAPLSPASDASTSSGGAHGSSHVTSISPGARRRRKQRQSQQRQRQRRQLQ